MFETYKLLYYVAVALDAEPVDPCLEPKGKNRTEVPGLNRPETRDILCTTVWTLLPGIAFQILLGDPGRGATCINHSNECSAGL